MPPEPRTAANPPVLPDAIACRLCGADARPAFVRTAEDGDDVRYYECTGCESLQTQSPDWIEALYATSDGASNLGLDTGAVQRCVMGRVAIAFLWRLGGFTRSDRLLDWGGGPGLLVRLLRDIGIDAHLYDKYSPNHYAVGFTRDSNPYRFVTAFEVFEHFANPATDLEVVFALDPRFLLISTAPYRRQGSEWFYLGPAKGEHVFFYSPQALRWIGAKFGYAVHALPRDTTLFYRPPMSGLRLNLATALLAKWHIAQLVFAIGRKSSLVADDAATIERRLGRTADR